MYQISADCTNFTIHQYQFRQMFPLVKGIPQIHPYTLNEADQLSTFSLKILQYWNFNFIMFWADSNAFKCLQLPVTAILKNHIMTQSHGTIQSAAIEK